MGEPAGLTDGNESVLSAVWQPWQCGSQPNPCRIAPAVVIFAAILVTSIETAENHGMDGSNCPSNQATRWNRLENFCRTFRRRGNPGLAAAWFD